MSKRVTIMDVAQGASVNYSTVSLALRGDTRIKSETRARIEETARRLGYLPNHLARSLSGGSTRVIGVMLTEMSGFFAEPLNVLQTIGEKQGYTFSVYFSSWNQDRERVGLRRFSENCVEGVIWAPTEWRGESFRRMIDELHHHGIPSILLGLAEDPDPMACHQVGCPKESAIRLGVKYLLDKGHREIGLATAAKMPGMYGGMHRLRLPAFRSVFSEMNLPVKETNIFDTRDHDHGGLEIAVELSKRSRRHWPTAIFATDDMLARGLAKGLTALGISVPRDISLLGFDVVTENSLDSPTLTTVSEEALESAGRSINLLLKILQKRVPKTPHQTIIIPPRIVEGTSCRTVE